MSGYKGLHLRVETQNGFTHGIGDGQGGVYTAIQTANSANYMIVRKSLQDFSAQQRVEIVSYNEPIHTKDEILNLVKYALVEDIRFNNCAEFINWCILGKKRVNDVKYSVKQSPDNSGLVNLGIFIGVSTVTAVLVGVTLKKLFDKK
ncbi:MAG: hypothetical protein ACEPO8_09185 [Rhodothermaceae bacterium]